MNHKIVTKYVTEEGVVSEVTDSLVGDSVLEFADSVAATATVTVPFAFDDTKVQAMLLTSTRATTFTFAGGADVITLAAGESYVYSVNGEALSLLTAPATSIAVHNLHATLAATVRIVVLLENTV